MLKLDTFIGRFMSEIVPAMLSIISTKVLDIIFISVLLFPGNGNEAPERRPARSKIYGIIISTFRQWRSI